MLKGSRLEIIHKDGNVICESVLLPKGDSETPLKVGDLLAKLNACAEGMFDSDRQEKIYSRSMAFEELEDVGNFFLCSLIEEED